MIVTDVLVSTGVVRMVNVAVSEPAGTTTLGGTAAAILLLLKATVMSAAATPVRVTLPVDWLPPITLLGLTVSEDKAGGRTVKVAERVSVR